MKKTTLLLNLQIILIFQFINGQTFSEKKLVTPTDDDVTDTVFFDIDQDNDIDIVAMASDEVFWYENAGDQTFSSKILLASGFDSSSALTVTDVDADGIEDILFIPRGLFVSAGPIQWIKNLGGGFFLGRQNFIAGSYNRIRIGDFDNDGLDDVIPAELSNDVIYWAKNEGNGSYATSQVIYNASSINIGSYEITDLDEDNSNEITVTTDGTNEANFFKFEIDNTGMITQNTLLMNSGFPDYFSSKLGDLDGDNKIDLVIRTSGCDVLWSKNFGSDIFATAISLGFSCSVDGNFRDLGDIDGDGDLDLFFRETTGNDNDIFWRSNDGSADFTAPLNNLSNDTINGSLSTITLFDIDTDGDLDVFFRSADEFGWFENISEPLSVSINEIYNFSIYPNPAKDILNFNTDVTISAIEIYNLIGQNIASFSRDHLINNSIDISNLSKGIYLLKAYIEDEVATFKVTKE